MYTGICSLSPQSNPFLDVFFKFNSINSLFHFTPKLVDYPENVG